jgi:hypothetical protein
VDDSEVLSSAREHAEVKKIPDAHAHVSNKEFIEGCTRFRPTVSKNQALKKPIRISRESYNFSQSLIYIEWTLVCPRQRVA